MTAEQATTEVLIATARRLFGQRGYGAVGTEEIVQQAGVTRGALDHHFRGGKQELFQAVLVQLSAETTRRIARAARRDDPWQSLVAGIDAFLDACATQEVRRIMLVDGPAVLGWDVWRAIDAEYKLVERALRRAIDAGEIQPHPPDALAQVLLGALQEAAMLVASADDQALAREETATMIRHLLQGIRTPAVR
ncbi:MAG: helix-turn-helix domain-containing protein [Solirubrobacteraceae bacterium]